MKQHNIKPAFGRQSDSTRRGAVAVYVAICTTVVMGMAALAVDIGMLYSAQAEMQRTADATALAATADLLNEGRLQGGAYLEYLLDEARNTAVDAASRNAVLHSPSVVNSLDDVAFGYVSDLSNGGGIVYGGPNPPNAIAVTIHRDAGHGGAIALYFAQMFGKSEQTLSAQATAAFADGVVGYKVTPNSGNADLLPFALHVDSWQGLLTGAVTTGDNYAYDQETGAVTTGSDGVPELNLYPGAGATQLPPGNFGTVDIGSPNNSTADIARQILYGINADDLSYFGGELRLGDDGTVLLNGDSGLSAGVKDELEEIKGQPRAIPIFSQVSGPGNNAMYTVVGFVGIRIMNVQLTGKMSNKNLIIQPAVVVDDSTVVDPGPGPSYYVYRPVQLVH